MGYYSYHDLVLVSDEKEDIQGVIDYMRAENIKSDHSKYYGLDLEEGWITTTKDGQFKCEVPPSEHVKWYDCDREMKEVAVKFPFVLMTLTRHGEETGDSTRTFYLGQYGYTVEAKFPEFDLNKLEKYGGNRGR